jgi:hypothetical protein
MPINIEKYKGAVEKEAMPLINSAIGLIDLNKG